MANTSNASKNVAAPTMILARTCQKVIGTRSSLARIVAAESSWVIVEW
jgi:hypothetical protein